MNRFYILGAPRSGTTLLRLCLDSHSQIAVLDQLLSNDVLNHKSTRLENIIPDYKSRCFGFKVPNLIEKIKEIDKEVFSDTLSKIIVIERNPLEVVSAMKELTPELSIALSGGYFSPGLEKIRVGFDKEVSLIENEKQEDLVPIMSSALLWKYRVNKGRELVSNGNGIKVDYKNFVLNPEKEIKSILSFLGLEWEESILRPEDHFHEECNLGNSGFCIGDVSPNRKIDTNDLGRIKLKEDEINSIKLIVGDFYEL